MKLTLLALALLVLAELTFPFDDTDEKPNHAFHRSGLSIHVDHGTGCQYLRVGLFGGSHPRLDEAGKPICGRRQ